MTTDTERAHQLADKIEDFLDTIVADEGLALASLTIALARRVVGVASSDAAARLMLLQVVKGLSAQVRTAIDPHSGEAGNGA